MLQEKHSYTPVPALAYVFIRTKKLNMIVLGSIAKLHLGELIEEAREIVEREEGEGYALPLLPKHLRAAARNLQKRGSMLTTDFTQNRLFRR